MNKRHIPFILILYGPTGVGKTDVATALSNHMAIEIINMDVGQFYAALSIGTAMPNWSHEPTPHHLFGFLQEPLDYTVVAYRAHIQTLIGQIHERGALPVLVGGSGFYLKSLLFPPASLAHKQPSSFDMTIHTTYDLWHHLHTIDPLRAAAIHINDRYRIERALDIWYTTGTLASCQTPVYNPCAHMVIVHLERTRDDLYNRINQRVITMMDAGWPEEARALLGTAWEPYIRHKGFIGYTELFDYRVGKEVSYQRVIETIRQKTRNYAKRQETFWRMLKRQLALPACNMADYKVTTTDLMLTHSCFDNIVAHLGHSIADNTIYRRS